jgi:hypothetical protein
VAEMSEAPAKINLIEEAGMVLQVKGAWRGWKGRTVVELTDGSRWKQAEYYYEYYYAYRPEVRIVNHRMMVAGMSRDVRVRRVFSTS